MRHTRPLDGELVQCLAQVPLCLVSTGLLTACPAAVCAILASFVLGNLNNC
jgi:hypothetical protein